MARRELAPAQLAVAQACRAALAEEVGPLVVGVSGGADSLALAAGVAWAARTLPIAPVAVVVDHGLQAGSDLVARRAAEQCVGLGIAAETVPVRVDPDSADGPEAAARAARHAALLSRPGPVLLGHTLDDQAETVLLGLARGSGSRSLAGIAPRVGRLVRPLLGLRRALVREACLAWGLAPWDDPHNADATYARVRVRDRVLPVLEAELGPGVAEALARTAVLARRDADHLDALAERIPTGETLDAPDLSALPAAVAGRVVRRWLVERAAAAPTAAHVEAVMSLLRDRTPRAVDLPGATVRRAGDALVCRQRGSGGPATP